MQIATGNDVSGEFAPIGRISWCFGFSVPSIFPRYIRSRGFERCDRSLKVDLFIGIYADDFAQPGGVLAVPSSPASASNVRSEYSRDRPRLSRSLVAEHV